MQMIPCTDVFSIPPPPSIPLFSHQEQSPNPNPNPNPKPLAKRKRNLPGNPDPDAEVIALSPKTLMATNRFVCEICNKGFQRDQNLQLHRRGHNLPWKLRQRTNKEVRKKVYICPETSCVHHEASRALGDLTGIKKHFSRKHGEKKWKCEKCSKKYAVQSDWKAHSKTCGSREYKCDCGTLFSRKDSFITHRAFCDALAEESARINSSSTTTTTTTNLNFRNDSVNLAQGITGRSIQELAGISQFNNSSFRPADFINSDQNPAGLSLWLNQINPADIMANNPNLFASSSSSGLPEMVQMGAAGPNPNVFGNFNLSGLAQGLKEDKGSLPCLYSDSKAAGAGPATPMSATALLQKAAQMGSTRSNNNNQSNFFGHASYGVMNSSPRAGSSCSNTMNLMNSELQQLFQNDQIMVKSSGRIQQGCSNTIESGLTRDFLGINEQSGRPFLPQDLAKFASITSAMGLSQFGTNP
ncbi:zinc finger protein JACKDAW [Euphorbia lathyris]|uniref:zinc finger protein JACKDAW n=1 Tax=Euphorbia lathyris TaxID=212925 RepID=UPI003313A57B